MTIVDAHHHVWDLSGRDQPWLAQPELPASTLTASYADVHAAARSLTADLSQAEQAAVFRDTAVRAYGLKLSR